MRDFKKKNTILGVWRFLSILIGGRFYCGQFYGLSLKSTTGTIVLFWFGLFDALRPGKHFSVMLGRSHRFLGITSTFVLFLFVFCCCCFCFCFCFVFFLGGGGNMLAQGHNTAIRVGLEPPTS